MSSAGDPWWLSITNAVSDQTDMRLAHLFGFGQEMALRLLCQDGLINFLTISYSTAYMANNAIWNQFIMHHGLHKTMERPNSTKVGTTSSTLARGIHCSIHQVTSVWLERKK